MRVGGPISRCDPVDGNPRSVGGMGGAAICGVVGQRSLSSRYDGAVMCEGTAGR